jgi:hypothetical protein
MCKKRIIIQVLLVLVTPNLFAQTHHGQIKVKMMMETIKVSNYYDKNVMINLLFYKSVTVPEARIIGLDYDYSGFYLVKLEKKSVDSFIPYAHSGLYNPPYQIPPILDTVKKGAIAKDSFYLGEYYSDLKKGKYRIKIQAFINQYNANQDNENTPWYYFELTGDLRPYLFRNIKWNSN